MIEYECEESGWERKFTLKIIRLKASARGQMINKAASAGVVLVGQGVGFIADRGLEEAVGAVRGKEGIEVFGAIEGERERYNKETEVKIE